MADAKRTKKTVPDESESAVDSAQPPVIQAGQYNLDELRTMRAAAEAAGDSTAHLDNLIAEAEAAARMNT
jgi:hypothetical protein